MRRRTRCAKRCMRRCMKGRRGSGRVAGRRADGGCAGRSGENFGSPSAEQGTRHSCAGAILVARMILLPSMLLALARRMQRVARAVLLLAEVGCQKHGTQSMASAPEL